MQLLSEPARIPERNWKEARGRSDSTVSGAYRVRRQGKKEREAQRFLAVIGRYPRSQKEERGEKETQQFLLGAPSRGKGETCCSYWVVIHNLEVERRGESQESRVERRYTQQACHQDLKEEEEGGETRDPIVSCSSCVVQGLKEK